MATDWIKRPKGLIEKQESRFSRQGSGDSDSLALAPRKKVRSAIP
jgi:hypothetical protein